MKKTIIIIVTSLITLNAFSQSRHEYYLFSDSINKIQNNELRATMFSFIGDYKNALIGYNKIEDYNLYNYKISSADSLNFTNCNAVDATDFILERAKSEKILLINEGHNCPMHRAFTLSLLQNLYNEGFRYFGAEAFTNFSSGVYLEKNGNSYSPTNRTGFYSNEPVFGDLIREALKIGFKLFSYEDTIKNNVVQNGFYNEDLSRRDYYMAVNIKSIIDKDSNAKIIIHAGFGHIYEEKGRMGGELKKLTTINPLSICQTTMTEAENRECENPYFKMANIKHPTVFINKSNDSVFLDKLMRNRSDIKEKNRLDIQVFHPRTTYINGRPDWLYMNGQRDAFMIEDKYLVLGYPLLVFAYYIGENIEKAIPIDVFEIKSKEDIKSLVLPKGNFNIIIKNKENKIIKYKISNEK